MAAELVARRQELAYSVRMDCICIHKLMVRMLSNGRSDKCLGAVNGDLGGRGPLTGLAKLNRARKDGRSEYAIC